MSQIIDEPKSGYIPLQQAIDFALAEVGDTDGLKESRFKLFAYEFLKKFHRDSARQVKTVVLPMSDIKTVTLPTDYINYIKIGTLVGDKIQVFAVNNSIANYNEFQNELLKEPTPVPDSDVQLPANSYFGFLNYTNNNTESFGAIKTTYGIGIGHNNWQEIKIDRDNSCIRFSASVPKQDIIIEYIGDGIDINKVVYINSSAEFLFRDFILYRHFETTEKFQLSDRYKRNFDEEYRKVRRTLFNFTPADIINITRKSFTATVHLAPIIS